LIYSKFVSWITLYSYVSSYVLFGHNLSCGNISYFIIVSWLYLLVNFISNFSGSLCRRNCPIMAYLRLLISIWHMLYWFVPVLCFWHNNIFKVCNFLVNNFFLNTNLLNPCTQKQKNLSFAFTRKRTHKSWLYLRFRTNNEIKKNENFFSYLFL
jgi:hypothetical protein